jgi:transcription initiation factor TFIIIB Brf1 subunit/transcription initiation factor TFIIB
MPRWVNCGTYASPRYAPYGADEDDEERCPDCRHNRFVEEHGDRVCLGCGLVVEEHMVDETPEYRMFTDDFGAKEDPSRVGASRADGYITGTQVVVTVPGQGFGALACQQRRLERKHDPMCSRRAVNVDAELKDVALTLDLKDATVCIVKNMVPLYFAKAGTVAEVRDYNSDTKRRAIVAAMVYFALHDSPNAARLPSEIYEGLDIDSKVFFHSCNDVRNGLVATPFERLTCESVKVGDVLMRKLYACPFVPETKLHAIKTRILEFHDTIKDNASIKRMHEDTLIAGMVYMFSRGTLKLNDLTHKAVAAACGVSDVSVVNAVNAILNVKRRL